MTAFQIVSVLALGLLVVVSAWKAARGQARKRIAALWIALFIAAIAAILFPERVTWLAKLAGIQRGADLVFYSAVLGGIVAFFYIMVRLRHLNRQLTLLVRRIAIDRPRVSTDADDRHEPARDGDLGER